MKARIIRSASVVAVMAIMLVLGTASAAFAVMPQAPTNVQLTSKTVSGHVEYGLTWVKGPNTVITFVAISKRSNPWPTTPPAGDFAEGNTSYAIPTSWNGQAVNATLWGTNIFGSVPTTFAPSLLRGSCSFSIKTSTSTCYRGKQFILTGLCGANPYSTSNPTMVGMNMHVDVKKPGKSYYSYSSNRTIYAGTGGHPAWYYKYTTLKSMVKGTYQFKAVYDGGTEYFPATSSVVNVAVK